jgi:capsular exopolysaccharide synthesis family protein
LDAKTRLLLHTSDARIVEHYRLLRTQILQQQANRMFRSILITSPGPGEGKTVTGLNLALVFAMLPSFQVLVVEGDLRKGELGKWLGLGNDQPGLGDLIEGSASLEETVLKSLEIPVSFMVRGNSKLSPAELLCSPRLRSSLQEMTGHFDLVLVDSPPTNLLTDAQLLASACDAVLVVVRAFMTSQKELEDAMQKLLPFRLIGSVLNAGAPARSYDGYAYYRDGERR